MTPQEFKIQIFKTPKQWGSGLLYRLKMLKDGGITLYSSPASPEQIVRAGDIIKNPAGLAADDCCQVYFMDSDAKSKICTLYRYDSKNKNLEQLSYIEDAESKKLYCPGRIILDKFTLWVNDTANKRILAFSRENYQLKYIIKKSLIRDQEELIKPIDIGLDESGYLYVLNGKPNKYRIVKYDSNGASVEGFELDLNNPVGLALINNNIYVLDGRKLHRFTENDPKPKFTIELEFQPSGITIDRDGKIFISESKKGIVHQLDPDGSYIGAVFSSTGPIQGIAVDSRSNLYISNNKGITKLSANETFTKETGVYYSRTLDSGIQGCQWHRIALEADLPPKTSLEVYYSLSDNSELKETIDEIIDNKVSEEIPIQEKAKLIDDQLKWSEPEINPEDMLFRGMTGRYLWLKLKLSTFDVNVRPAVTQIKVLYPRTSYLRYLPAIYQEDQVSKEFLDRFLSIFETVSYDLETKISRLYKYFDSDTVPQDFVVWLASWLNIALEEDWQEDKKRQLIREASTLYKLKGTPYSITRLIEIHTGKKPLILEHTKIGKPAILGGKFKLGVNSFLIQAPVRGFRLGDDSILGRTALRDGVQSLEEPFLPMAYRFTIILDLSDDELIRYEKGLRRIIDAEKPAHTEYYLRFLGNMRERMVKYIEISTRLDDFKPVRLGVTAVGSGIVLTDGEQGGRMKKHVRVEQDTQLI